MGFARTILMRENGYRAHDASNGIIANASEYPTNMPIASQTTFAIEFDGVGEGRGRGGAG